MVRAVQTLGVLALICAGAVLVHCADQWLYGAPGFELDSELPVVEHFRRRGGRDTRAERASISPLVEQAKAFASYLNPTEPVRQRKTHRVASSGKKTMAPANLPGTTAKFVLIATSCYGARPEKSLALVSEPGKPNRWVRPGTRLGHFVLERVEQGSIVCRDGDRSIQMAVKTKAPARRDVDRQITLVSGEAETTLQKPPAPRKTRKTRTRRPMQRLGPARPESPLLARDQMSTNG